MANEYAAVAQQYISDTMKTDAPSLMSQALVPDAPSEPRKTRNVVLGGAVGALAMLLLQAVMFILDDKVKTSDDISRHLDLPTLAVIPKNVPPAPSIRKPVPHSQKGGSARA